MSDFLVGKDVFGGRFELIEELGRGSQGITYLAHELGTGKYVAVKKLAVRDTVDWKSIELFEREGQVLKSLNHEGIPRYIDAFHEGVFRENGDGSGRERFVLVQEYVEGENLGALIAQGLRMDEAGTRDFLEQMLGVLAYLHALEPQVIHRDIKPSNIMRRADGRWVLIDFGGVQAVAGDLDSNVGASTVVGTSGYMPFEQLVGRAVAASDLYALGATLVHLLSHRHPSDLPVDEEDHMRLLFQEFVTASTTIMELLEGMLEPLWEDRIESAEVALGILGGNIRFDGASRALVETGLDERRPEALVRGHKKVRFSGHEIGEMQIVTKWSEERVRFEVTRRGSSARAWEHEEYLVAMVILLGIGITVMRAFFLYVNPSMSIAFGVGTLSSFVVAWLYRGWMRSKRSLEITAEEVRVSRRLLWGMKRRIGVDRVSGVRVVPKNKVRDEELGYVVALELDGGDEVVRFGTGQTRRESEWMAEEIRVMINGYREG